jgi:hypothetical protein
MAPAGRNLDAEPLADETRAVIERGGGDNDMIERTSGHGIS